MKLVISDPCLNQLLRVAARGNGIDGRSVSKFRRRCALLKESCGACLFCKTIESVAFVASSIVELVNLHGGRIVIYLVVPEQSYLFSTYLVDYIRCLYTWIVYFYQNGQHESQLTSLFDLNYTDAAIIPVYDWRILLNAKLSKIVALAAKRPDAEAFVYVPGFPLNCADFFRESLGDIKWEMPEDLEHIKLDCQAGENPSGSNPRRQGESEDHSGGGDEEGEAEGEAEAEECDGGVPGGRVETRFEIVPFENVMCCGGLACVCLHCGIGTFDRLHFGHKLLLLVAYLSCGRRLHIGIAASRELLGLKEDWELVQSYQERLDVLVKYIETLKAAIAIPEARRCAGTKAGEYKRLNYNVCDFLCCNIKAGGFKLRESDKRSPRAATMVRDYGAAACVGFCGAEVEVSVFPLMDVLGPCRYLEEQHVLVISPDVLSGALHVNRHRREHALAPWHIATVGSVLYPRTLSSDAGGVSKLCSSLLRRLSGRCLQLD